ncbi:hypothetical protein Sjap_024476 [Stephania japonica]|uniref:Uncharacterized protein n=1 Tax=Stephania japonica TaxID=461633 RepID=A0AAP0EM41_9MAGN
MPSEQRGRCWEGQDSGDHGGDRSTAASTSPPTRSPSPTAAASPTTSSATSPLPRRPPPSHFRLLARSSLSHILSRHRLPLIVGGSNSFIHALVTSQNSHSHSPDLLLHYDCCFLWVDVALPVLNQYLFKRVDDMFDSGMLAELAAFYDSLNRPDSVLRPGVGLMKAIGVPEFAHYFSRTRAAGGGDAELFREAVDRIKDNTCRLAEKQMGKIQRLRGGGWEMRRLDATDFFEAVMAGEKTAPAAEEIWEERVLMPTVKIVKSFLEG